MSKRERILLRVAKGALVPADALSEAQLRKRCYQFDDQVYADITKPRDPRNHRRAHVLAKYLTENTDRFTGYPYHDVLKTLQLEAHVECDEYLLRAPNGVMFTQFVPRSISYASMGEAQFWQLMQRICDYVANTYWPDCSPEKIDEMAGVAERWAA